MPPQCLHTCRDNARYQRNPEQGRSPGWVRSSPSFLARRSIAGLAKYGSRERVVVKQNALRFAFEILDPGTAVCFGDGSGTACPCGNPGQAGAGCQHTGGVGMRITGSGTTSLAGDNLVLTVSDCPHGNSGLFFVGKTLIGPGNPLFDGLQCSGGDVRRFGGLFQTGGTVADTGFVAQDPSGFYFEVGTDYYYQYWSRDVASGPSPCGMQGNSVSSMVSISWVSAIRSLMSMATDCSVASRSISALL